MLGVVLSNAGDGFHHEALLYADADEFLAGTVPFVRDGVWAGEPVLVAVGSDRAAALQAELGAEAETVQFIDMLALGRNPARIIPAWRDFVDEHGAGGRPLRGIGEPIWPGRTPAELVECHHHESLLNLAFAGTPAFSLLCPYDVGGLDAEVVDDALCTHPHFIDSGQSRRSAAYLGPEWAPSPFEGALPPPAEEPKKLDFGTGEVRFVRAFVSEWAAAKGMSADRTMDLVLAVSEVATNSVVHAGGGGTLHAWQENGSLMCEVRDDGHLQYPLTGRERPVAGQTRGRGLWLANNVCDLVQMRTSGSGNVVRLHMSLS